MNHEEEYREEAARQQHERRTEDAEHNYIYRDPYYPPQWAEAEWEEQHAEVSESE